MHRKPVFMRVIVAIVSLFLCASSASFSQMSAKDSLAYIKEIEQHRKDLHKKYKKEDRPLTAADRKNFKGLDYFPTNIKYCVDGIFEWTPDEEPFKMKTTTTRTPLFVKFGTITFMIDTTEHVISVYQNMKEADFDDYEGELFIPFTDKTTGKETYGGGRFMDFKIPESEAVRLDFNLCYNPWCAYNERYSCPVPTDENALQIDIKAGEKDYGYGH